jgi:hypothetical protein
MRRLPTALVLVSLAATAGCGGDGDGDQASSTAQRPASSPAAAGMPVGQYVTEYDSARAKVEDTRGDYAHSHGGRAAVEEVRDAYSSSATALEAIEPPAVAKDLHQRTLALWRKRTQQLDRVLSAPRFKRIKANRVLQGTSDQEGAIYNEVYTLAP